MIPHEQVTEASTINLSRGIKFFHDFPPQPGTDHLEYMRIVFAGLGIPVEISQLENYCPVKGGELAPVTDLTQQQLATLLAATPGVTKMEIAQLRRPMDGIAHHPFRLESHTYSGVTVTFILETAHMVQSGFGMNPQGDIIQLGMIL